MTSLCCVITQLRDIATRKWRAQIIMQNYSTAHNLTPTHIRFFNFPSAYSNIRCRGMWAALAGNAVMSTLCGNVVLQGVPWNRMTWYFAFQLSEIENTKQLNRCAILIWLFAIPLCNKRGIVALCHRFAAWVLLQTLIAEILIRQMGKSLNWWRPRVSNIWRILLVSSSGWSSKSGHHLKSLSPPITKI